MTDPERLSRSPANSLTALLLRAGAEEKPSAAVFSRTTEAVAVAAGVVAKSTGAAASTWGVKYAASNAASAPSVAASTSLATAGTAGLAGATIGIGAVAKWIAIGALGGALAMSSVQALVAEHETKHVQAVSSSGTNAPAAKPSQRSTVADRAASMLVASADPQEPERPSASEAQKARSPEPALTEPAKTEAPAHTDSAFLAAEVHFVDQGRAAFQRAAFAEALEQLAPYESLFPHQQLLTEVLFLRMEALSRLGNVERARSLAARVLALGVVGRQAAQAREVLGP